LRYITTSWIRISSILLITKLLTIIVFSILRTHLLKIKFNEANKLKMTNINFKQVNEEMLPKFLT